MKDLLYSAISLLPSIAITIIVAYFYARKKEPNLLILLIAYAILTVATALSHYMPYYMVDRALSAVEMQRLYMYIGIASLIAQVLLAVGLAIVLSRYPDKKKDPYDSFS